MSISVPTKDWRVLSLRRPSSAFINVIKHDPGQQICHVFDVRPF
jgi:hypothetical protein